MLAELETERALVATLVNYPDRLDELTLNYTDFSSETYGLVFRTAAYLHEKGLQVSPYAIIEKLTKRIGAETVLEVCDISLAIPSATEDLARIVKESSLRRKLAAIGKQCIEMAQTSESAALALEEAEKAIVEIAVAAESGKGPVRFSDHMVSHWDVIEGRHANRGKMTGVTTGLSDLDAVFGGWQAKDLVILAARPSMGKTALMLHAAHEASRHGVAVIFSAEMGIEQLSDRLISAEGHIPLYNLRNGFIEDDEFARLSLAASAFSERALYIDDSSAVTMGHIRVQLRKLRRQYSPETKLVAFLDYLQLVREKGRSRNEEVSAISQACKAIAKDLNCTFVALSQLSRACEQRANKRPMLSDLRESGSIEQDADVVGFLYRDEYYDPESDKKNIAEVIIAKNRNGPTGTAEIIFLKNVQKFVNIAKPQEALR